MKVSSRVMMTAALACVGVLWVWWSYTRHATPAHSPGPSYTEPSETVKTMLGSIEFDAEPTEATVASLLDRAVQQAEDRVRELSRSGDGPVRRVDDLVRVFGQSLRNTIVPNFDVRCEMMRERGDEWVGEKLTGELKSWTTQAELTRDARFGTEGLEVRVLYQAGVRVAPEAADEGFSTVMSRPKPGRMPIAMEPDDGALDIVEVRLPMEKGQVAVAGRKGKRPVLVGYQFAWSKERGQWIPWLICQYTNPNEIHYAIYY